MVRRGTTLNGRKFPAITIRASAAEVWPWLVQIGHQRAGWYSYDWIHRLIGVAGSMEHPRRSAERVLHIAVETDSFRPFDPREEMPANHFNSSWTWFLDEFAVDVARLIVRIRVDYSPDLANALMVHGVMEPGSFVMERWSEGPSWGSSGVSRRRRRVPWTDGSSSPTRYAMADPSGPGDRL